MPYRLRFHGTEIELSSGSSVIGRSAGCKVVLDGDQVSRRHARLSVADERVTIIDLDSANGVFVNGERVERPRLLSNGDLLMVGGHQLELVAEEASPARKARASFPRVSGTRPQRSALDSLWDDDEDGDESYGMRTEPVSQFQLVAGAADQLLARGRVERAESLLEPHLLRLLERASQGRPPSQQDGDQAVSLALELARGSGAGRWIDFVFDLQHAAGRMLAPSAIDELATALRAAPAADHQRMRQFIDELVAKKDGLGAKEQNALSRLMALEAQLDS